MKKTGFTTTSLNVPYAKEDPHNALQITADYLILFDTFFTAFFFTTFFVVFFLDTVALTFFFFCTFLLVIVGSDGNTVPNL